MMKFSSLRSSIFLVRYSSVYKTPRITESLCHLCAKGQFYKNGNEGGYLTEFSYFFSGSISWEAIPAM